MLEIARDEKPDPNCTIQDLSNCDISGIPETLDFDQCFQDVEMMTEEEARRLLSKKTESAASSLVSPSSGFVSTIEESNEVTAKSHDQLDHSKTSTFKTEQQEKENREPMAAGPLNLPNESNNSTTSSNASKNKVRFSEEPAKIFDTHAVEDYDRRNDDIDPVAASAEYEIEKSRERQGLKDPDESQADSDDEQVEMDEVMRVEITEANGAVITLNPLIDFSSSSNSSSSKSNIEVTGAKATNNRGIPRGILVDHGHLDADTAGPQDNAPQSHMIPQDDDAMMSSAHDFSGE